MSRTWQDKQAIDESGVMHGLTGTDSARPTVNMCRQDRISTLAARRHIYLALARTPNSTEPQLPRLRGADNTCKRLHSQHYQHWDPVYTSHRLTEHDFAGGISHVEWWSLVGAQAGTARAACTCVFNKLGFWNMWRTSSTLHLFGCVLDAFAWLLGSNLTQILRTRPESVKCNFTLVSLEPPCWHFFLFCGGLWCKANSSLPACFVKS